MAYIAALHVGTTYTKCHIYEISTFLMKGQAEEKIDLLTPAPGHVVINPDQLFNSVVNVVKTSLGNAHISAENLKCLGISTHRNSFITWDKRNGRPYHDIVTWRDTRADDFVKEINKSDQLTKYKNDARATYNATKNPAYRGAGEMKFNNLHVLPKLHVLQKNDPEFKKEIDRGHAQTGTLETWLLYRFGTGVFASDYTNLSATGYFNPYTLHVKNDLVDHFKLKHHMIAKAVDNAYNFGFINQSIFGHRIKIGAVIASQSASMYGNCCFYPGDVKLSLGTGTYLNYTTGTQAADQTENSYPIVAWCMKKKDTVHGLESVAKHNGAVIEWAKKHNIFTDLDGSAAIARSVPDNNNLFFVPAFDKSENPLNEGDIQGGFVGVTYFTTNNLKVRAILECLAYQAALVIEQFKQETSLSFNRLKVDGGVSKNDFVCQLLADCSGLRVDRSDDADAVSLGTMFLSGLNQHVWRDKSELEGKCKVGRSFQPSDSRQTQLDTYAKWKRLAQKHVKVN